VDLWENLLAERLAPADFNRLAVRALPKESDEQNAQFVLSCLTRAFWLFEPRPQLEDFLRDGIARAKTASRKSAWFNAYRDVVLSKDGLEWLARVWRREEKIEGLPLAEPDEINLAMELAVREVPGWQQILATQRDRTQNPDRKARFDFVVPALSADPAIRQQAFDRLREVEGRRREPWALESLHYLNHPLREQPSIALIRPSLDLLEEVQRTGDIFFPQRWTDSALGGHRSPEAARIVQEFLAQHPKLPERLRWTVLVSADELFRINRR
jgi:aminopeptidase N